jgi:4-hydroxy-2-oxoheptanedioate aldolase
MLPAQQLQAKVARGDVTTGILVTDHLWTDVVEVSARAGLDYLIVDMEHGSASTDVVAEVCATGRRMGFAVLVRPRANDYANLRLAIDLGACGFLLACVESADDLDVVRDAIHLPPRGRRRPGGMGNRWVNALDAESWRTTVEDHFIVLPQIETRVGLTNVVEIAKHEITTCIAVGPYDLSAELGVCGEMQSPILKDALRIILAAGKAAGKPGWMIGGDAAGLVRDGWNFVCFGEATWVLEAALRDRMQQARQAGSPAGATSSSRSAYGS